MIRLAVRTAPEQAEAVLSELLELAPSGVEQVDGDGFVEYALYGAPGELPSLPAGEARIGDHAVLVRGEQVPDDWEERWKRFHSPVLVGGRLWVRPPWEEPAVRPGVHEIVIDPGQAFGTGTHPSTRMCLELLLRLDAGGSVVDLGCGSGVLAIAAAKLGFAPVTALDCDPAAVRATERNARENAVELDRVARFDLRREAAPAGDVVLANLQRRLLMQVAGTLRLPLRALIISGLLEHEAAEVASAFGPELSERDRLTDRGWSAVLLTP